MKRYDNDNACAQMVESVDGNWVKAEDAEGIQQELNRAKAVIITVTNYSKNKDNADYALGQVAAVLELYNMGLIWPRMGH